MNMKLDVCRFSNEDVIATSFGVGPLTGTKNAMFYIPSSEYGDGTFPGNYVYFQGNFGGYNGAAYEITNISGAKSGDSDRNALLPPAGYFEDEGVTIDPSDMWFIELVASKSYDAYSYGGNYYTNGVNYYTTYYTN